MKKADIFNPGQWLIENKLTKQSQLNEIKVRNPLIPPDDIQEYLLGMIDYFGAGNDNEYEPGTEMEFRYEGIEYGDKDVFDEEDVNEFKKVRDYLKKNGPITINNQINYNYSTDGEDIIMNWIEPNWGELNEIKINNPDKQVNFKSIEVDGDDPSDYPDFSDAYIAYAEYEDGTPLTDAELEQFQEEHPDLAAEMAFDNY